MMFRRFIRILLDEIPCLAAGRPSGTSFRRSPFVIRGQLLIMAFDFKRTISIIEQTPATLQSWLDNLPEEMLYANEGEGTWSPFDILGHLIHGGKTDWVPRTKFILFVEDNHFTSFDRFAHEKKVQESR